MGTDRIIDLADLSAYHAHVYYDADTRDQAAALREAMAAAFDVTLGRWRETPVGPHPKAMYQVTFAPAQFGVFVPWLLTERRGLDILVHTCSAAGDLADHTAGAMWLGHSLSLDLSRFR